MKFWGIALILAVGVLAYAVGQRLSADAIGMAVGVVFGVLAGVPAALLVLSSGRRRQEQEDEDEDDIEVSYDDRRGRQARDRYGALPPQAPVIVFAPPPSAQMPAPYGYTNQYVAPHAAPALPGPTPARPPEASRAFRVVGEQEEWITEW